MRRLLVVVTVYFLVFGYAQVVAGVLVFPGWRPGTPELLVLLVGPNAGWLIHQARRNALTRWVLRATWLWMGLAFLLFSVVVPVHLLLLLGLPGDVAAVLLVTAYAPLAVWSIVNAHRLEVRRVALSSPKLDRPARLVQISDVHVGSRGAGFLPRIVRRVNALDPDAVFVTGDLVDLMNLPEDALDSIGALAAPAFFAIGNHERYVGSDAICTRLETLGVAVLRNARAEWGTMRIVGIDDAETRGPGRARARTDRSRRARPRPVHDPPVPPPGRAGGRGAGRHRSDALRAYPQRTDRAVRPDREALLPPHRRPLRCRRHGALRLPRHRHLGSDDATRLVERDHRVRAFSGAGRRGTRIMILRVSGTPLEDTFRLRN